MLGVTGHTHRSAGSTPSPQQLTLSRLFSVYPCALLPSGVPGGTPSGLVPTWGPDATCPGQQGSGRGRVSRGQPVRGALGFHSHAVWGQRLRGPHGAWDRRTRTRSPTDPAVPPPSLHTAWLRHSLARELLHQRPPQPGPHIPPTGLSTRTMADPTMSPRLPVSSSLEAGHRGCRAAWRAGALPWGTARTASGPLMRVPQLADPRWGPSGPTHSTYWLRSHELTHSLPVSTSGQLRVMNAGESGPRSAGLGLWPQRTAFAELESVALVWSWLRLALLSGDGRGQPPGQEGRGGQPGGLCTTTSTLSWPPGLWVPPVGLSQGKREVRGHLSAVSGPNTWSCFLSLRRSSGRASLRTSQGEGRV